jgi:divalent metal cation (Fe/Co/Zn/Cd) transporter
MESQYRERQTLIAVNTGLGANVLLATSKRPSHSGAQPALLADGVNSTSDVAYYILVSVFTTLAKPADKQHRTGTASWKASPLMVGAFVMVTGIVISGMP